MLPTSSSAKRHPTRPPVLWHWARRLIKPKQMDFQYTFWTMIQLLISPKTAYRQTSYQKQTKNVWMRDDPAFVVVTAGIVAVVSLIYGMVFSTTTRHAIAVVISSVAVDYLTIGCGIATITWLVANKLLQRRAPHPHSAAAEPSVEWGYCFDVHCNAFWPLFLLLGVVQLLLCPVLLLDSRLASLISSFLYATALSHYCYITFLGFSALPFLDRTEAFMYPVAAVLIGLIIGLVTGMNPTKIVLGIYYGYE